MRRNEPIPALTEPEAMRALRTRPTVDDFQPATLAKGYGLAEDAAARVLAAERARRRR